MPKWDVGIPPPPARQQEVSVFHPLTCTAFINGRVSLWIRVPRFDLARRLSLNTWLSACSSSIKSRSRSRPRVLGLWAEAPRWTDVEECGFSQSQVKDLTLNTSVVEIPSLTTSNMYSGHICAYRLNEESACERDGKKNETNHKWDRFSI